MTATTTPPAHPTPIAARPAEDSGRLTVVRAEWLKFRTVRGWLIGVVCAMLALLAFTFVVTNGHQEGICTGVGACQSGHPFVPAGPDGQAVADSYQYYAQPLTGSGTLTVHLTSLTGVIANGPANQAPSLDNTRPGLAPWAKAGLLLTPATTQGTTYAAIAATGSHGIHFQYDYTHDQAGPANAATPRWLRLTRSGDTVTGYASTDGATWQRIGTTDLARLPSTVQIGLFVTSPVTYADHAGGVATQATARFDSITLTGATTGSWHARSIGMSPLDFYPVLGPGTTQASGDTVTISGSGDIAPTAATIAGGDTDGSMLQFGVVVAMLILIVIATGFITTEYRRGLIRITLAATPRRGSVLAAKATVVGAVAFAAGTIATAAALPLGQHILASHGNYVFPQTAAASAQVITGSGLLLALTTVGVLALGTILRRAAGAITAGIIVFVLPTLLGPGVLGPGGPGSLTTWLYRTTPAAAFSVFGTLPRTDLIDYPFTLANGYYPLPPWAGLAVLGAWTAAALGLAGYLLRRRDA